MWRVTVDRILISTKIKLTVRLWMFLLSVNCFPRFSCFHVGSLKPFFNNKFQEKKKSVGWLQWSQQGRGIRSRSRCSFSLRNFVPLQRNKTNVTEQETCIRCDACSSSSSSSSPTDEEISFSSFLFLNVWREASQKHERKRPKPLERRTSFLSPSGRRFLNKFKTFQTLPKSFSRLSTEIVQTGTILLLLHNKNVMICIIKSSSCVQQRQFTVLHRDGNILEMLEKENRITPKKL